MKRLAPLLNRYWAAGLALACLGVVLARWAAPQMSTKWGAWTAVLGQITAIAGLFIIAVGIQRRIHRASADQPASTAAKNG